LSHQATSLAFRENLAAGALVSVSAAADGPYIGRGIFGVNDAVTLS
ncbi:hypothetical protein C7450_1281, partial [Chelatococcus asaccharovorans]